MQSPNQRPSVLTHRPLSWNGCLAGSLTLPNLPGDWEGHPEDFPARGFDLVGEILWRPLDRLGPYFNAQGFRRPAGRVGGALPRSQRVGSLSRRIEEDHGNFSREPERSPMREVSAQQPK